jgi:hypothetical protein
MQHHFGEIARNLAPTAHAIVVLDRDGWHTTGKLRLPENFSLLPLPSKSPEPNPTENVWRFPRHPNSPIASSAATRQSSRPRVKPGTASSPDPARITSIGTRQWAIIARH